MKTIRVVVERKEKGSFTCAIMDEDTPCIALGGGCGACKYGTRDLGAYTCRIEVPCEITQYFDSPEHFWKSVILKAAPDMCCEWTEYSPHRTFEDVKTRIANSCVAWMNMGEHKKVKQSIATVRAQLAKVIGERKRDRERIDISWEIDI